VRAKVVTAGDNQANDTVSLSLSNIM